VGKGGLAPSMPSASSKALSFKGGEGNLAIVGLNNPDRPEGCRHGGFYAPGFGLPGGCVVQLSGKIEVGQLVSYGASIIKKVAVKGYFCCGTRKLVQ